MTSEDCPFPTRCPVPDPTSTKASFSTVALDVGQPWFTVYETKFRSSLFNHSGIGNSRFSPLYDGTAPVGSVYLARQPVGALLETAFHEIRPTSDRRISLADLRGRGLRQVAISERILLADLRDPELVKNGLTRDALVSTSSAHYGCTREWAAEIRSDRGRTLAGIMWHSRVGEIAAANAMPTVASLLTNQPLEVCVLFADRMADTDISDFDTVDAFTDLSVGGGLALAMDLAVQLGGYVEP